MSNISIEDLVGQDIIDNNFQMFVGSRDSFDFEPLTAAEEKIIESVYKKQVLFINQICPQLAADLLPQMKLFIKMGGVAKAMFPGDKGIKYPGEVGSIVVDWITPQNMFYAATPSSTYPCYNGYTDNTWDVDLTAGTEAFLLGGDASSYYKSSPTDQAHSLTVLAQNGLVEIGTTPKIGYMNVKTQN